MFAVLVWGLLLALGTYLYGRNMPLLRAAIVAGCTLAFLLLWVGALASRKQHHLKASAKSTVKRQENH
jgi:hypothetical protein